MPVDVEMKLVADNSQAVKSVKELEQANNKLHSSNEKNQKRQIGLIADVEKELDKLQKAQKNAYSEKELTKYNQKIAEAKQALKEYNEMGLKAEKQTESLTKSIGQWALSIGGAAAVLNVLKEAFLATTAGINLFNIAGAATKQVLYNLVTGASSLTAGLNEVIKAQKELNELRFKEKVDLFNSTKQQILYNKYLVEAKDQTKSLTERLQFYDKALEAHNKRMDMEISTMKERAAVLKKMIDEAPTNEKLLMEYADLQIEMLNAEVRRYAGQKEVSSMRSGLINAERQQRLDSWHKEIEEQNQINQKRWDAEDKLQKEINEIMRSNASYRKKFAQDTWNELVRLEKAQGSLESDILNLLGISSSDLGLQKNVKWVAAQKAMLDALKDDGDKTKKIAAEKIDALKGGLTELYNFTQEIADRELEDAQRRRELLDTRVDETQQALEAEIKLYEAGYASNVALKQKELAEIKKQRDKALKEEEEAIRKQRAMENIAQGVNLFTSATNILKSYTKFGPIGLALAAGAITAMFSIMTSAKKKSAESAFAKGGWTGIGGQRDATGERVAGVVHGEEFVVRRGQAHKFRGVLEAINRNDKKAIFNSFSKISPQGANVLIENNGPNQRLDEVNNNLKKLQNKEEIITTSSGTIIKRGNIIRTIKR